MNYIELKHGHEARESILKGAEQLFRSVVATLGSGGRNAMVRRPALNTDSGVLHQPPMLTKDGVTVAMKLTALPDKFEDMGLQLVKEASQRTNKMAGDGTSSSTLLAYEMMKEGARLLDSGANAIHLRRGINKAVDQVCEQLKNMSRKVETTEEMQSIATISSQDSDIGALVTTVFSEVGEEGSIAIDKGSSSGITYDVTNGMSVVGGYVHPVFAGKRGLSDMKDPFVLVTTEKITSIRTIAPLLEKIHRELPEGEPMKLVIFSEGVEGDALTTLATNHKEHPDQFRFLVTNPPYFGDKQREVLEDIAIATGATLIDKSVNKRVKDMDIGDLGTCEEVVATEYATTIIGLHGSEKDIEDRIAPLQDKYNSSEKAEDQDYYKGRIASLRGKIAKIYVGGSSQAEQIETQHRVEDAVAAVRAASQDGILPGGGVALLRCAKIIDEGDSTTDEKSGFSIVREALYKQLHWVAKNAGEDPEKIIEEVLKLKYTEGYNTETGQYGDMYEMKVIDPTKVPITALRNAASVAGAFLTTEVAIVENYEK